MKQILTIYLLVGAVFSIFVCLWARSHGDRPNVFDFIVIMLLHGYYAVRMLIDRLKGRID